MWEVLQAFLSFEGDGWEDASVACARLLLAAAVAGKVTSVAAKNKLRSWFTFLRLDWTRSSVRASKICMWFSKNMTPGLGRTSGVTEEPQGTSCLLTGRCRKEDDKAGKTALRLNFIGTQHVELITKDGTAPYQPNSRGNSTYSCGHASDRGYVKVPSSRSATRARPSESQSTHPFRRW